MRTSGLVMAAAILLAFVGRTRAADLQPVTLRAWNEYLQEADSRLRERVDNRLPFLWMDESADRAERVRRGEVPIAPVVGHGTQGVPGGLIHDWIGDVFIPGATIGGLLAVVHDFDAYARLYRPVVASSRTLACGKTQQEFEMVWQRHILFVSAAMLGRYQANDVAVDEHRGYSIAETVEVREIEEFGHKGQRLLPPDTGNGFLWRIRSIARYEERDGGVYLELEAIALTRDIPASLAWMVTPAVHHLSVNSLTSTLVQTRDAAISSRRSRQTDWASSKLSPKSPAPATLK